MNFEEHLKAYFKESNELDMSNDDGSDTAANKSMGLDKDRRDAIFALARASCESNSNESVGDDIKDNDTNANPDTIDKNKPVVLTSKHSNKKSSKKTKVKQLIPYAIAALFLLAVAPVLFYHQTMDDVNPSQVLVAKEKNQPQTNQEIQNTPHVSPKIDKRLVENKDNGINKKNESNESEALIATRQIIEGKISLPVYDGDVSPSMQGEIKKVNNSKGSGMVIHVPKDKSVEDSKDN